MSQGLPGLAPTCVHSVLTVNLFDVEVFDCVVEPKSDGCVDELSL